MSKHCLVGRQSPLSPSTLILSQSSQTEITDSHDILRTCSFPSHQVEPLLLPLPDSNASSMWQNLEPIVETTARSGAFGGGEGSSRSAVRDGSHGSVQD